MVVLFTAVFYIKHYIALISFCSYLILYYNNENHLWEMRAMGITKKWQLLVKFSWLSCKKFFIYMFDKLWNCLRSSSSYHTLIKKDMRWKRDRMFRSRFLPTLPRNFPSSHVLSLEVHRATVATCHLCVHFHSSCIYTVI